MLFNEQEMIELCNEMGIELIDNDGNTNFPVEGSSLFNIEIIYVFPHVCSFAKNS